MGKLKRIQYVFQGVFLLFSVWVMLTFSQYRYMFIVVTITILLTVYAINQFIYYFTLARYMVGGTLIFCKALIALNFAVGAYYLTTIPKFYVMLYLTVGLFINGVVCTLRGIEKKKKHINGWKIKLFQGIIIISISLTGLIFSFSERMLVFIICIGLVSSAITKFVEAFRKTAVVYIGR